MRKFINKQLIKHGFKEQPVYRNAIKGKTLDVTSSVRRQVANKMGTMSGLMMNGLKPQASSWDAERQLAFGPKSENETGFGHLRVDIDLEKESKLQKFWRATIGDGRDPVMQVLAPLVKIHHIGLRAKSSIFGRFEQRYYLNNVEPPTDEELRRRERRERRDRFSPFG